jgi:hypothetical protein
MNIFNNPAAIWRARPFPRNLESLRHAMVSYAQFGEDLLIQEILGYDHKDVRYLDLGAFHPIAKSNTCIFSQRGGRGVVVEPNPLMKPLWSRYRGRDLLLSCGVTPCGDKRMFYHHFPKAPGMNYFADEPDHEACGQITEVGCRSLRSVVGEALDVLERLDLVSIDCEGMDEALVAAFPFDLVRPRVFAVEDFHSAADSAIERRFIEKGYVRRSQTCITKIFVTDVSVS